MRARQTMWVFLSGCSVYVLMAACSGSDMSTASHSSSGSVAGGGRGGGGGGAATASSSGGHGGTAEDSGIFDVLTDPVPDADAAPMSGARLKKKYLLGDDGTREDLPGWYDSQRLEDCNFMLASDGKSRCLPGAQNGYLAFTDPACSQPILWLQNPPMNCPPNPPNSVLRQDLPPNQCGTTATGFHVYTIGAKIVPSPPNYFNWTDPFTCAPIGFGAGQVYQATEVPSTSFVAGMQMVDP